MRRTRNASRFTSSLYFSQAASRHDQRKCAKQRKAGQLTDRRRLTEVGKPRTQHLRRVDAASADQKREDDAGDGAARDKARAEERARADVRLLRLTALVLDPPADHTAAE